MIPNDIRSSINKFRITFEYLQYGFLKDTNINGKPIGEIIAIEVDHEKRMLHIYFQGDIQRAEAQACPEVTLNRDEDLDG